MLRWLRAAVVVGWSVALVYGCSTTEEGATTSAFPATSSGTATTGSAGPGSGGGLGIGGGDAGVAGNGSGASAGTASGGAPPTGTGPGGGCVPGGTQCTDCIDNDGDGWIDSWDVECVGPLDNDESSFATGIPGDNIDACKQDCFFDGNSGQGDDGCNWDLECDPKNPGAPKCPYDPNKKNCPPPPSAQCLAACAALTPNGCDCFGCCVVQLPDQTTVTVSLSGSCTEETLTDPNICKPCTQQVGCLNTCDTCEYCLGKTQLPPECFPDGGTGSGGASGTGSGSGGGGQTSCPDGEQSCSPNVPCPVNYYCLTGCCIQIPS